ncbi:tetratricopeptide repeat protein [Allorhodopirellula solitaria]|uniref:Tetratricopeptide repeat protein n=1 Tax=Allorhodopirellula solitaria TaxID=2527987 RepID=A0A5C5YBD0_9BACT|nr:tetratricopeptide repeat protein [Allorhodopirellula solitaria]TWT73007.1 hypothetical protein CA85_14680 [Allorhodopirellula solitaria]
MTHFLVSPRVAWFAYLAAVLTVIAFCCLALSTGEGVLWEYGRWDVLACSFLAAMPLSLMLAQTTRNASPGWRFSVFCGCLLIAFAFAVIPPSIGRFTQLSLGWLTVCRCLVAVASMTAVAIAATWIYRGESLPVPIQRSWKMFLMMSLFAAFVPAAYVDAVADGLRADLENSLQSRRFALAYRQSKVLWQLDPGLQVQNKPLAQQIPQLQRAVSQLAAEASRPLPSDASVAEIGQRVTILMHLDENEEALRLLKPLTRGARFQPIGLDYQGLCWQRLRQYRESLSAYQDAVSYWTQQPDSDRKQVSLASAWKGIGFAARHLSQRSLEEEAYRTLVELAPSAENHFLLAQCYSEHQKSKLAAEHSAIAVRLNPDLQPESTSMLTSMSRDHFGCLQIP